MQLVVGLYLVFLQHVMIRISASILGIFEMKYMLYDYVNHPLKTNGINGMLLYFSILSAKTTVTTNMRIMIN